jgi:hypothetical protein
MTLIHKDHQVKYIPGQALSWFLRTGKYFEGNISVSRE